MDAETRALIKEHIDHALETMANRLGPTRGITLGELEASGAVELLRDAFDLVLERRPPRRASGVQRLDHDWSDATPADPLVAKLRPFNGPE